MFIIGIVKSFPFVLKLVFSSLQDLNLRDTSQKFNWIVYKKLFFCNLSIKLNRISNGISNRIRGELKSRCQKSTFRDNLKIFVLFFLLV